MKHSVPNGAVRPVEPHSMHFDFSHLDAGHEFTFNHSMVSEKLKKHTAESLKKSRKNIPLLRAIPDKHLTHYIDIDMPSDCLALIYVTIKRENNGIIINHPVHLAIHIPNEGREHARQKRLKHRGKHKPSLCPKLARIGISHYCTAGR